MKRKILDNLSSGSWSILEILNPFELALKKRLLTKGYSHESLLFLKTLKAFTDFQISDNQFLLTDRVLTSMPSSMANFFTERSIPGIFRPVLSEEVDLATKSLASLKELYPTENALFDLFPSAFIFLKNADFYGASHPHILGAIILGEKFCQGQVFDATLSIIHEMGHQELFLINTLDRVVVQEFDFNMIHAPFQGRERPPIARMHSLFALYRMVQLERKSGIYQSANSELMKENLTSFSSGELTDFGSSMVLALQKWFLND